VATTAALDRRRQIVEKSANLFDKFGYHNTSMEQIAEEIGIAKPSLYHYFRSKAKILFEIDLELHETLTKGFGDVGPDSGTRAERLRRIVVGIVTLTGSRRGFLRVLMEYRDELPPKERAVVRRQAGDVYSAIKAILQEGTAMGEFRPFDAGIVAQAILGMTLNVYQWYRPDGRMGDAEIGEICADFVLSGLLMTTDDAQAFALNPGLGRVPSSKKAPIRRPS
jgi:AcrR family transcriptional regulator